MADPNVELPAQVAESLGDLRERFVFVGGCATSLLLTDPAAPPVRVTQDVDAVVAVVSLPEYQRLGDALRARGLSQRLAEGDPPYRWVHAGMNLAFLYGYHPTTILLDEPDAHLHVNLQREILDYFKRKSLERNTQFLIATHAEEFARGVDASQIVSLLSHVPKRIQSAPEVLRAMAEVSNEEIARLMTSPCIVYVEGESDERILRAWADQCSAQSAMDKVCFKSMEGGGKENMKARADEHFAALKHIIPEIARLMLFDYDNTDSAFHPKPGNPALAEWKRKNIENYLLVPDAWKRAALQQMECGADDLFAQPVLQTIDAFFAGQNLTLPPGKTWRNVTANVFSVVDGKRILFEDDDSLFHQLRNGTPSVKLIREQIAMSMVADEIHEDVHHFIGKLIALAGNA